MQIAQDKQPTVQGERQNAAYEERSGAEELVGTTVGPWWLPPAVVALLLPGCFGFVRSFVFHAITIRFLLRFWL